MLLGLGMAVLLEGFGVMRLGCFIIKSFQGYGHGGRCSPADFFCPVLPKIPAAILFRQRTPLTRIQFDASLPGASSAPNCITNLSPASLNKHEN
jgi:hypothetical protein